MVSYPRSIFLVLGKHVYEMAAKKPVCFVAVGISWMLDLPGKCLVRISVGPLVTSVGYAGFLTNSMDIMFPKLSSQQCHQWHHPKIEHRRKYQ